jgi:hypothetical protein
MRSKQAAMLTGLPVRDLPADILELPAGQGYLLTTRGELRRITQPRTTPDDMQRVAALLPDHLHSQVDRLEVGSNADGPGSDTGSGCKTVEKSGEAVPASRKPLTAEEAQILALARQATPITTIIETVWGSKGGNKFKDRAAEVMRVIAEHLQGGPAWNS